MASKCRKFVPNIFNKTKCQTCFGSKEQHSAEALENNKASRKVSKCGYLFVAPGYDFSNPLDKTKRWQRRFFVLYDDGELAYSVDENPDTVPQGVIDMNKCTDVKDATGSTSHSNSLAIITPEKTTYIKGNSKEEIQWWHDVLIVYPRSVCKPKQRRFTVPSYSFLNKENLQPKTQPSQEPNGESKGRFEVEKVKTKDQALTYRGVRNMKHTKGNKNYQEGLRKSSSLHDLTTEEKEAGSLDNSRFLSRSGDRLDDTGDHTRLLAGYENNPYATLPRSGWKSPVSLQESSSNSSLSTSASSIPDSSSGHKRRGSFDDKALQTLKNKNASERARLHRERSASMKSFPTGLTLPKIQSTVGSVSADRLVTRTGPTDNRHPVNENETDELKMAKSTEMQSASRSTPPPPSPKAIGGASTKFEDLMYMKKGWLIKMGTSEKDWKKHWFVLTGNSLRYYKDAKAEESNSLDGRIDLSTCYEISEVKIQRNYGFKIKTRNGEYTLSAMTSGIRSNWMKAIRLCMDLQNSNKNAGKATSDTSQRTNDDMDIDTSSSSSGISDKSRGAEKKKEPIRNIRRHYSDVNPGNIGKMFSIKGLTLDNSNNQSQSGSSRSSISSAALSKEPSIERETHQEQMAQPQTSPDSSWKPGKYDQVWSGDTSNGIPFRRFVEGSDDHVTAPVVSTDPPSKSSDKSDDEDRKKRAKSPSAKIKDRSRAKSPKLHSPPPGHDPESTFSFTTTGRDEDKMSVSSEDIDFADGVDDDNIHLDADHNLATSAAGEGMLVDLLENEVESLKERLEHTQQELAKSHDSNRDLKTKLQSVVREKDNSGQMNVLKRQLKDAKDSVQRQKSEIDQLKSKLDMSTSKLTGTEKALSEALKDVKQEKDKFLKVTQEYNKKVRSMENQLKEVTSKMEKYHENSLIKDKENRKLDLDLKQHLQKLRDHEREIIKLKAVEHEFRQMKEKLDENEKVMSRLRKDLKDKNDEFKKMEMEYEVQFENMMQDFTKERDDTEHHIEELKTQLVEASRKSGMSDQVSKDVANLLRDKDEIIAQLEEKVIENESKMVEMSEEIKTDVEENTELHQNIELLQEERDNAVSKIKDMEKALSQSKSQVQRMDKENQSIRKHMDDLRKENTDLSDRLDAEKTDRSTLKVDNDGLKSTVKELEQEVHSLHDKLNEVCSSHDRLSVSSDGVKSQELLHTLVLATADMNDVSDSVLKMRKQFESILATYKGDKALELIKIAEMVEDICKKCDNVSEVLKEGASLDDNQSKKTLSQSKGKGEIDKEIENMKKKNSQMSQEAEQYKIQLAETQNKYKKLKDEDHKVREQLDSVNRKLESKVDEMNKRIHNVALKVKTDISKKTPKKKREIADPRVLSEEIDEQLGEIEDRVAILEKALATQDLRHTVSEIDNHTETEESEAETEDSEDYLLSDDESEESDSDSNEEGTVADENETLIGKLQELKNLFSITNARVKDLSRDIPEEDQIDSGIESVVEKELRETLLKCGEKIDSLSSRLSENLESARTDIPRFSDQTWAFRKCINKLKSKVEEVSILAHENDELNAKDVKALQGKLQHLVEYVVQIDKLGENDWDIAGKIAKQEMKFQHLLLNKEKAARKSTLKYEDRLQLYADKMAFEAMILGQMGILIQRQQVGTMYKDALLREIHEANLQILELERRIDNANREINPSEQEKDMVSSYAAILAERIVLEGQLASCAMVQNVESSENMEILTALNVDEMPTVLAMEIFIRSQVDSSISEQLKKTEENMAGISNHIVTRALLQGEISHALKVVKQKFKISDNKEDLSSCVKRERQFAYEELESRHKMILDLVNETEPVIMTTLIQLIEFSQGPNSPTLHSVCDHIQSVVRKTIEEYEHVMESADSNTKNKVQLIIAHLHSELDDALAIFQEEYNCYVQTASPDIDPNVLKFSANSLASELAGLFIQKAVIDGSYAFICEFYQKNPEIPVGQMVDRLDTEGNDLSELAVALGQILLSEAANKQKVASEVRNATSEDADEMARNLTDLIGVIPDLEAYPQSFNAYTATLVREAMFQSQLTYTTYKLKMHYHRDLRDIKLKLEAGEAVVLPSEISKEAESDIQASLATFEDILNTKYQDECAVLSLLESEIGKLKNVIAADKGLGKCKTLESNFKQLQKTFEHEVSVAQERQNVHTDVLRQKVNNVILRVDKFLEDNEKEKERMKADYEDRIATLQDEFDLMTVNHEEELEQVRQDIMTAVSAIKASEEEAETNSVEQLKNHNKQLMKMSVMCKELLTELKAHIGVTGKNEELADKIESQLVLIQQIESDPNFTLDTSLPLTFPDSPGLPPKTLEPPQLDRTLSAEKSDENVDKLLERSQHEHEMELLKREKEAALAEEIKTTRAALDAMQKAYTEDLEQEKEKYRYALKTMFTDDYVEEIRRRHESEHERIAEELKQLSMHYESKCEDYKLMEDRLQRTKQDYQTHINHLVKSNEQLTELVNSEIENLKTFIQTRTKGQLTGSATLEEELYDSQIMVRVKDAELQKLRQQVKNLENSLERTTEEQRYTMTQYLQCLKKNQEMQAKMKQEILQPKERRDSAQEDQLSKSARALRRNPSFHQRARSPSPDTSPRKDNSTEHHSRDSHRRSRGHLSAKDLKRSKSSPSLPFVFEAKSPAMGSMTSQSGAAGLARRESGKKYGKNSKK